MAESTICLIEVSLLWYSTSFPLLYNRRVAFRLVFRPLISANCFRRVVFGELFSTSFLRFQVLYEKSGFIFVPIVRVGNVGCLTIVRNVVCTNCRGAEIEVYDVTYGLKDSPNAHSKPILEMAFD